MNVRWTAVGKYCITMLIVGILCMPTLSGCASAPSGAATDADRAQSTQIPAQPLTTIEADNGALYVEGTRLTVILNTFEAVAEGWQCEILAGAGVFRLLEEEPPEQAEQQAARSWTFEARSAGTAVMAFTPYDAQGEKSGPGYRFTFVVDAELNIESDAGLIDLAGTPMDQAAGENAIRMAVEIDAALAQTLTGIVSAVYEVPAEEIELSVAPYTHAFSDVETQVYTAQCADGRSCDLAADAAGAYAISEGVGTSRFRRILMGEIIAIGFPIVAEPSFDPDALANKLAGVLFGGQPARRADTADAREVYVDHRAVRVYAVGDGGFIALDDGGEHLYCDPDGSGTYYRVRTHEEPPIYRIDRSRAMAVDRTN